MEGGSNKIWCEATELMETCSYPVQRQKLDTSKAQMENQLSAPTITSPKEVLQSKMAFYSSL